MEGLQGFLSQNIHIPIQWMFTISFLTYQIMRSLLIGIIKLLLIVSFFQFINVACGALADSDKIEQIRPFPENPHYLAWGDTPVFLLGATGYHGWTPISRLSSEDIHAQLHHLGSVIRDIGSPHVRGFLRCLPYDNGFHSEYGAPHKPLNPWLRLEDGRYDLRRFEPAWEKRLRDYLGLALELGIVVSLEVWDDWSVTRGIGGAWDPGPDGAWNRHPFNPDNNINYDNKVLPDTTTMCDAPFYSTIPANKDIPEILELQMRYVDHLLSIASEYSNILINISNESRANLEWSRFWATYIKQRVPSSMMVGEMPSTNRIDGGGECETIFNPLTLSTDPHYDFVDIAQAVSGHEFGGNPEKQALEGSRRILEYRRAMVNAGTRRPLIVSKDYTRTPEGGTIVFWSRFVGGAASSRFHRPALTHPPSVISFQHESVGHLGRFIARVPFWLMHPRHDVVNILPDGAGVNVLTDVESHYVIQLIGGTDGGKIGLEIPSGRWAVQWINPATGKGLVNYEVEVQGKAIELDIPGELDHRIIHLEKKSE